MVSKDALEQQLHKYLAYLENDPDNTRLMLEAIQLYTRLGCNDEALAMIAKTEAKTPNDPALIFAKATLCIAANQPQDAAKYLNDLLVNGIDNAGVRYNLAYAYALQGKMEDAQEIIEPSVTIIAQSVPEASLLLSRIKHHMGDLEQAKQYVTQFLDENSDHPQQGEAMGILALLALDDEDSDKAREYANQALAINPENSESLVTLGTLSLDDYQADDALDYYQKVLQRQPRTGRAWLGVGLSKMLQKDMDAAESALQTCVEYMPEHLGAWNTLAWCQILKNKIDDAETTLLAAKEINHNFGETHGGLAIVALFRNQPDETRVHIKRALGLNKNSFSANLAQSLLLSSRGHNETAQKMIGQMLQTPIGKQQQTINQMLQKFAATNQSSRNRQ